jgi:citrate lyase beta subunit
VLTFPKVTEVAQVEALVELLALLEERLELGTGTLRFEIQVETTQSIVDAQGRLAIPRFLTAGAGRVSGLHFGTYDYTAACGLSAAEQHLAHAACDFARHVMQVGAAGTGVRLSDGSSNVLPVGDGVREAWQTHFALVQRSLVHGFYQGWDMHPAQLVTRYAANFVYYLRNAEPDARRLRTYVDKQSSGVLDEPATAQALAMSLRRALDCGALSAEDVERLCGLTEAELAALAHRETP